MNSLANSRGRFFVSGPASARGPIPSPIIIIALKTLPPGVFGTAPARKEANHASAHGAPVVQAAPAVSALGVVDIASICELLGVSRSWLENTIRQDETFPRPFKIGARRLVKFADLQASGSSRRHVRLDAFAQN